MFRPFGSYAGSGEGKGRLERAVFAFLGERGEALGHTRFFVSLTTCRLGAPERGSYADPFGRRRSSGFDGVDLGIAAGRGTNAAGLRGGSRRAGCSVGHVGLLEEAEPACRAQREMRQGPAT